MSRGFSCPLATRLDRVYVLLVTVVGLIAEAGLMVILRGGGCFLVFVLSRRVVGLGLDLDLMGCVGVLGCLVGARVRFLGTKLASSELLGSASAIPNESSFRDWFLSRRSGSRF